MTTTGNSNRAAAALALLALAIVLLLALPRPAAAVPPKFFGVLPQHVLNEEDIAHMKAARIGAVRWPLAWAGVQPQRDGAYEWGGFDGIVETAARGGIRVMPFLYAAPDWATGRYTNLPVRTPKQRRDWAAFVRAAAERYGPRGSFWRERRGSVPKLPIREWQIWNEANFFYFATPASPTQLGRLLKISAPAVRAADPGATVIVSGLFGEPNARPPKGLDAVKYLRRLYRVPGIKASFDGIALHPYSETAAQLEEMTEEMRQIAVDNRDRGVKLYLTEMGWGSQNTPNLVSFERGPAFQIREMRRAYRYLIGNRGRLNLKGTYWFTWKDLSGSCNFCDSTGFFREAPRLKPKAAWPAFVAITGGRARP